MYLQKSNKQKNWILSLISVRDQDRTKMLDRQGSMVMTDYLCKVPRNFVFENGWLFSGQSSGTVLQCEC